MATELTQLVAVRVSAETAQAWRDAAQRQGVGLSDLIRTRMAEPGQEPERTGRPTPARGPGRGSAPKADPQLVGELARIGNNLNQIARHANRMGGNIFGRLSNPGATAEYVEQLENAVARFVSRPWRRDGSQ